MPDILFCLDSADKREQLWEACLLRERRRGPRACAADASERTKPHHADEAQVLEFLHAHLGSATEKLARRAALCDAMTPHTTRRMSSTLNHPQLP
jgi:hypothetical protein